MRKIVIFTLLFAAAAHAQVSSIPGGSTGGSVGPQGPTGSTGPASATVCASTSTASPGVTYACPSPSPTVTSLTTVSASFDILNGANPTLNVATIGNKALMMSDCATPVPAGYLAAGPLYPFSYGSGNLCWLGSPAVPAAATSIQFPPLPTSQGPLPQVATIPSGTVYYASNASSNLGSDSYSCTLAVVNSGATDGPCLTIAGVQTKTHSTMHPVLVRAGTYTLGANLVFSSADNGAFWQNYPGESPVLDGNAHLYVVALNGVNGLAFNGFTLQNMAGSNGTGALLLNTAGNKSQSVIIRWNLFSSCYGNCIYGAGMFNSIVDSNTFTGAGTGGGAQGSAIIWFSGPYNNQVTHNLIEYTYGSGINLQSNQTDPGGNNLIGYNKLRFVSTNSTGDNGAIYFLDQSGGHSGNQITGNDVYGAGGGSVTNGTKCIYLDDWTSYVLVNQNICRQFGEFGFQIHGGTNNTFLNNLFDLSQPGSYLGYYQASGGLGPTGMNNNTFGGNVITTSTAFPSSGLYQLGTWQQTISAVTSGSPAQLTLSAAPGTGQIAAGTYVIAGFTGGCVSLNGPWIITNVDSTHFTIPTTGCASLSGSPVIHDVTLAFSGSNNYYSATGSPLYNFAFGNYGTIVDPAPVIGDPQVENLQSTSSTMQNALPAPLALASVYFAGLPGVSNSNLVYCIDCTATNPVAGGGTGVVVRRENGAWNGGVPGNTIVPSGLDPTCVADSTTAINTAITSLAALGGGTVYVPAPSAACFSGGRQGYSINSTGSNPLVAALGVSIRGDMPATTYTAATVPEGSTAPSGGTWFNCNGNACLTGQGIRGSKIEELGFANWGGKALSFGGNAVDGIAYSSFEHVYFYGNPTCCTSDTAIALNNVAAITMNDIQGANVNVGINWISQNNYDQPGNSVVTGFQMQTYAKSAANSNNTKTEACLVFQVLNPTSGSPKHLDYITFVRPQCQMPGSGDGTGYGIALQGYSSSAYVFGVDILDLDLEGNYGTGVNFDYAYNNSVRTLAITQSYSSGTTFNLTANANYNHIHSQNLASNVADASNNNYYTGLFNSCTSNMQGLFTVSGSNNLTTCNTLYVGTSTNKISLAGTGDTLKSTASNGYIDIHASGGTWNIQSNGTTAVQISNQGIFMQSGTKINTSPTTTSQSGTSGTAVCSMGFQGTQKQATCYLNGYAETGTAQTYSFPTAFSTTPVILESGGSCGTYNPSTTASTLTLPANAGMTAETCNVVLIGQ